MNFDEFRIKHSDLIHHFQIIEGDLKWIFAIMLAGELDDNYSKVEKMTLGQIVNKLKELDKSGGEQYISDSDYNFLKQMTEKRNYWCHECYRDFVYETNWEYSNEYQKVCQKLDRDWQRLETVCRNVEKAKIRANDVYER